jgi:hypothetical protein
MRYQEHPTWRMLEKGKATVKHYIDIINTGLNKGRMSDSVRIHGENMYDQLRSKHNKLVSLQLQLEDKINQHD